MTEETRTFAGFPNRKKFLYNVIVDGIFIVLFVVLASYARECYFQAGYLNGSQYIRYDSLNRSIVAICEEYMNNATVIGKQNFTINKK